MTPHPLPAAAPEGQVSAPEMTPGPTTLDLTGPTALDLARITANPDAEPPELPAIVEGF